ncbi:MAG: 2-C-methyl-D-erythritol 4-phosphate cytidylyltransferase [Kiritimatiellia bacterium]
MNYAVIVAGGRSERMGPDVDKAFLSLGVKPVLAYSVAAFEKCADIDGIVLVVRKDRLDGARGMVRMYGYTKVKSVVAGGTRRQTSVAKGLAELNDEVRIVTVHDGCRPCVTAELISDTLKAAKRYGSGVSAAKVTDTIKYVERGTKVTKTVDRSKLWSAQTPQTFKRDLLVKAFETVKKKKLTVTDEASAVELISKNVHLVPAPWSNIKITTPDDLAVATVLLKL